MNTTDIKKIQKEILSIGKQMYDLMVELYPICRSITGNGVRETHEIIKKHIPMTTYEIPTGIKVYDWNIPKEWNINDAYIIDPKGNKILDFKQSNLHVMHYSIPIKKKLPLKDLKSHIFTLPNQPDLVPYRTSFYNEDWGFCMTHKQYLELQEGEYEICIDSKLENGSLTYGEYFIKGEKDYEVLISCYTCHPSLCNDNLSGIVLATFLSKYIKNMNMKYSYRFLFIPETIGAISWLYFNEQNIFKIKGGLVATCLGDSGISTYKKSRRGNSEIDIVTVNVLKNSGKDYKILDFFPIGSDERQFCSPGFNLPIGSLMRTPYHNFIEYHTSADNLQFVKAENLADTLIKYLQIIFILENNKTYQNLNPKCEPQLGKRGIYRIIGGERYKGITQYPIFWVLNLSDGYNSLLDISEKSGIEFSTIKETADLLVSYNLLSEIKLDN